MCTLTYLLNDSGYELFFNRDEQHSRLPAIPPMFNQPLNAIFPVDPQGKGTWVAVNQQGLTLALLNYYQVPLNNNSDTLSRGQLILSLLQSSENIIARLEAMDLHSYQPFQLCIFPESLSKDNPTMYSFKWTGNQLFRTDADLPITSSSIHFNEVSQQRKRRFIGLVDANNPTSEQLKNFHFSTEAIGKYSVNMHRSDAQTVSISHIVVNNIISFNYFDNVLKQEHTLLFDRITALEFDS